MTQEPKEEYPCTQQALYSIAGTIYDNGILNITAFTNYKGKYTIPYFNGFKANVTTAKNIPDEEARNSAFQVARLQLIPLNDTCAGNFQLLKGYINDAFPQAEWNTRYEAAGQTSYRNAEHENWEMMVGVNTAMKNFITANLTALLGVAGDNMPPAFQATVTADSNAFDLKYAGFIAARQTSDETAAKITANNKVYGELVTVCDDGQRIYSKNEPMKKMFVFETVKALISPPGSASLKVTAKRLDNTLIAGATVTIQAAGGIPITLLTDENGVALFNGIDPSDYNGTITATGLTTATFVKEVNTGTNARLEIIMS